MMDCDAFADRLDAMLEGALPAPEQALADAHLARCAECRGLFTELRALRAGDHPAPAPPADLTDTVLARTSGPVCGQAESYLGELVDGTLGATGQALVEAHLEHCPGCAGLRATLERLADDLPAFAELEPSPTLVTTVVERTHPRPAWGAVARERVRDLATGLLQRPRIAWEAGYAAALVVWLVFGASWSPLRATPVQALTLIQQGASDTQRAGAGVLTAFNRGVTTVATRTFGDSADGGNIVGQIVTGLSTRFLLAADAAPDLGDHWRQFTTAVQERDLPAGVDALQSLGQDAGAVLSRFVFPSSPTDPGGSPERRSTP
ncbi:MAG: hypothetical protein CL441_04950 [Acidimicrobiaceae bacterium]|nr:hypothetical protein [Acidimicrobiaceae bacterium]